MALALEAIYKAEWDEQKHPRGKTGEFAPKNGGRESGETFSLDPAQMSLGRYDPEVGKAIFGKPISGEEIVKAFSGGADRLPPGTFLRASVVSMGHSGVPNILVSVAIRSKEGQQLGDITRTITKEMDGSVEVSHDGFGVIWQYQGTGYGSEMFLHAEEQYRKWGVDRIRVHADSEVGGYAWARMGFEFSSQYDKDAVVAALQTKYMNSLSDTKKTVGQKFDALDEFANVLRPLKYPYEFAAIKIKRADGTEWNIGKEVMLNSNWQGVKPLKEETPATKAGDEYLKIKKMSHPGGVEKLSVRADPTPAWLEASYQLSKQYSRGNYA